MFVGRPERQWADKSSWSQEVIDWWGGGGGVGLISSDKSSQSQQVCRSIRESTSSNESFWSQDVF